VDGFGFAITHAACLNLLMMNEADRQAFLEEIFSREKGIGSSMIRVCIGGSDFSMDEYTWCDTPGIDNFAVHPLEEEYLFPILRQIFRINPDVKIIGSPWSCPRWMKIADDFKSSYSAWTGGRLNPVYYSDYAQYFVKWIQEMESRGFPIYAVTLQNEPLNRGNSMSLYMSWQEQRDFIKQAVGPAFSSAGLNTKLLLFDHNYNYDGIADQQDYPIRILEDADAAKYVAGSAWHNYGGKVSTLDKVHQSFPDKEIYFTEASIGEWNYNYESCLLNDFRDIFLGTLGRYGRGVTLWNLMLDSENKPYRPGGCSTCFGGVTLAASDHSLKGIVRNSQYYNVAHCSKVLQPGAVRLGTTGYKPDGVTYQWYRNPDGSYAVILLNEGSDALMHFVTDKVSVKCRIPAKCIQSLVWTED
jgi:glucosylceramidase